MNALCRLLCLVLVLALSVGAGGVAMSTAEGSDDTAVTTCCDTTGDQLAVDQEWREAVRGQCHPDEGDCLDPHCSLSQVMLTMAPLPTVFRSNSFVPWTTPTIVLVFLPGLDRPPRPDSVC